MAAERFTRGTAESGNLRPRLREGWEGSIQRSFALVAIVGVLAAPTAAHAAAASLECKKQAAAMASSLYGFAAKQFRSCSKRVAGGESCVTATRNAKVAGRLAKAQSAILKACSATDATAQGFANLDALAVRVAGAANGEGRQVADSIYGRVPASLPPEESACAAKITSEVRRVGKKTIKDLILCGGVSVCGRDLDDDWDLAKVRASSKCAPAAIQSLISGDLSAHVQVMRAGAERVAALAPSLNPVVSVLDPVPGVILTPPGIPFDLDVEGVVVNVPHAGYVNSFEIDGEEASFDQASAAFSRAVEIDNPGGPALSIFLKARTTLGTVATTASVRLNLGSLAPDVVITSPASGTITAGSSITVSGQVTGDLSKVDQLVVAGQVTSFDDVTGAFSHNVSLTSEAVQILAAEVPSDALGTRNTDSVVVLKGIAWPFVDRVPGANFNRLNNTGFERVSGLLAAGLDTAFAPLNVIGQPAAGGIVAEFSTGTKTVQAEGAAAQTLSMQLSIEDFHLVVIGIQGGGCVGTFDADLSISLRGDLEGTVVGGRQQLGMTVSLVDVAYTSSVAALSGQGGWCSLLEDLLETFTGAIESDFEVALTESLSETLPGQINDALGGLDISGPIGAALNVEIDARYASISEDTDGVTFTVDSNVLPIFCDCNPLDDPDCPPCEPPPDLPDIKYTLLPASAGNPNLGPRIPGTLTPYDLAFCLSDGFLNRAIAAFMRQGMFNQTITQIPFGANVLDLNTGLIGGLMTDSAYGTACPGCGVTLVLKPTAAAVTRPSEIGEDGIVTLIVPNYQIDVVAEDDGRPVSLLKALVTFELPIQLDVAGNTIAPSIGTLVVKNVSVTSNPIGANEAAFEVKAALLFPRAAEALGGLFAEITLPSVEGLTLTAVGAGRNVSCTAIYMRLS